MILLALGVALGMGLGFIAATRLARRQRPPVAQPVRIALKYAGPNAEVFDLALARARRQQGR